MTTEKERFEILLEEMRSNFKAVSEGHGILVNKIDAVHHELHETKDELNKKIEWSNRVLHEKIDGVKVEFKSEIAGVKEKFTQEIRDVKKGIDKIDSKLDHVIERQDTQEIRIEKIHHKVFSG